jgi:multidrug efflux pump subunit AcrA (membrane-fusion protein)
LASIVAATALVGADAWYGWSWWTLGRFIESTDDAYVGGEVTTIAAKVAGFIENVAIADNQSVKAGDLLVKLDDRDYRAQLARAEASVAAQSATLANLDANRRLQQAMIEQAGAEIAATAAEVDRSKYDVDRYRALAQHQFASVQRFQQADADYRKAVAADRKAHAALDAAERQLDVIETQRGKPGRRSIRPLPIGIWRGSTSATRRSARRSTGWSPTAARGSVPTARRSVQAPGTSRSALRSRGARGSWSRPVARVSPAAPCRTLGRGKHAGSRVIYGFSRA